MVSNYWCAVCYVPWPCTKVDHNQIWSNKVWMSDSSESSIACYVLDHDQCTVSMFCACVCHHSGILDESPISLPPSNR